MPLDIEIMTKDKIVISTKLSSAIDDITNYYNEINQEIPDVTLIITLFF